MKIQSDKDFGTGLMFALFGVAAVVVSIGLPLGTTRNIGPGYFPMLVGGCLVVLGAFFIFRALLRGNDLVSFPASFPASFRPLALVTGAVVAFAFLIETVGLLPATVVLVVLSSLSMRGVKVGETIILAIVLSMMAIGIFVYGLGLPYRILILP